MPDSLTIREATADDLAAIRDLYQAVWGYTRPSDYDQWRFFTPPDGICPIALAEDCGRLAGAYTLWPARLNIGGEIVLGAQSMDTMTHPDYQGRGLFTKLALACFEMAAARGFEVLYGFPNPLSYPGFVRRLNWDHTGDIVHWIRPLKLSGHAKIPAGVGLLADGATVLLPGGGRGGYRIVRGPLGGGQFSNFVDEVTEVKDLCRIHHAPTWMDWRYGASSHNQYEWIQVWQGDTLKAVIVWGMRSKIWGDIADRRAHLVEIIGSEGSACLAGVSAALKDARSRGAILMETLCNESTLLKILRRASFFAHRRAPFIVRSLTARNLAANIHNHETWRIIGGDVDTF